jgi:fumarylacetoacetate (FAA) hydrolase
MQFDFPALIAHAAKTRPLPAGTIIGSGTVSNADTGRGYSCIVEKRVLEQIESGEARTPYLRHGETVRIEMLDRNGRSVFGAIEQDVLQ